jgi:Domain of unknown function (DUF4145)
LDWINSGAYDDQFDYILFGRDNIHELIDELADREPTNPDDTAIHELVSDLRVNAGRTLAAEKTSLHAPPKLTEVRGLRELSTEARHALSDLVARQQARLTEAQPATVARAPTGDSLDAAYANEVVQKLDKIMRRVSLLDAHEVDSVKIGSKNVRDSFEQAHKCYLYGFNAACAVLCRATLEAALKSKFDPKGRIEAGHRKTKGDESLITALLKGARLEEPLEDWFNDVRKAGGRAVHDYASFSRGDEASMPDILAKTRGVLAALYPKDA